MIAKWTLFSFLTRIVTVVVKNAAPKHKTIETMYNVLETSYPSSRVSGLDVLEITITTAPNDTNMLIASSFVTFSFNIKNAAINVINGPML